MIVIMLFLLGVLAFFLISSVINNYNFDEIVDYSMFNQILLSSMKADMHSEPAERYSYLYSIIVIPLIMFAVAFSVKDASVSIKTTDFILSGSGLLLVLFAGLLIYKIDFSAFSFSGKSIVILYLCPLIALIVYTADKISLTKEIKGRYSRTLYFVLCILLSLFISHEIPFFGNDHLYLLFVLLVGCLIYKFNFSTFIFSKLMAYMPNKTSLTKETKGRYSGTPYFVLCILLSLFISYQIPFGDNHWYRYNPHFEVLFSPIVQLLSGTLGNTVPQYGLYPVYMEPFLSFFAPSPSVLSVTTLFAGLLFLVNIGLAIYLFYNLKNKVIAALGFLSYMSIMFGYFPWPHDIYLQTNPLRTFVPILTCVLSTYYLNNPSKKKFILVCCILSFFLLWNIESSSAGYVSFTAFAIYHAVSRSHLDIGIIFKHIACFSSLALLVLTIIVPGLYLYLYLHNGSYPDFTSLTQFQSLFGVYGFYSLPIKNNSPFFFVITVYIFGLAYSIGNLFFRQNNKHVCMVFLMSTLGLLLLPYYINRSYITVLTSIGWPAVIILALFADDISKNVKNAINNKLFDIVSVCGVLALSILIYLSTANISHFSDKNFTPIDARVNDSYRAVDSMMGNKYAFAIKHIPPAKEWRDDLLILSMHQSYWIQKLKARVSHKAVNFSMTYWQDDFDEIAKQVEDGKYKYILFDDANNIDMKKNFNGLKRFMSKYQVLDSLALSNAMVVTIFTRKKQLSNVH